MTGPAQYLILRQRSRDDSARFTNQQNAGRDVPRREIELPESVEPAAGYVG